MLTHIIFPFPMVHMPYVIIPALELKQLGDSSPLPLHLQQVDVSANLFLNERLGMVRQRLPEHTDKCNFKVCGM